MNKLNIVSVLLFLISGCVIPPDIPACRSLETKKETKYVEGVGKVTIDRPNPVCNREIKESSCGFCIWTISDKEQYVGEAQKTWLHGKPWSHISRQAIKVPAEDFAKIKKFIIDICKKTNECSKDIDHWRIKLDSLDSVGD